MPIEDRSYITWGMIYPGMFHDPRLNGNPMQNNWYLSWALFPMLYHRCCISLHPLPVEYTEIVSHNYYLTDNATQVVCCLYVSEILGIACVSKERTFSHEHAIS